MVLSCIQKKLECSFQSPKELRALFLLLLGFCLVFFFDTPWNEESDSTQFQTNSLVENCELKWTENLSEH